jgi:1-phosphatidylinositol-4-phosphate 5-kinase
LKDHELIDYSLLVGIHDKQQSDSSSSSSRVVSTRDNCVKRIVNSQDEEQVYYIGVIDLLTAFSDKKRLELMSKSIFHVTNQKGLSVAKPSAYAQRFMEFMEKIIVK